MSEAAPAPYTLASARAEQLALREKKQRLIDEIISLDLLTPEGRRLRRKLGAEQQRLDGELTRLKQEISRLASMNGESVHPNVRALARCYWALDEHEDRYTALLEEIEGLVPMAVLRNFAPGAA